MFAGLDQLLGEVFADMTSGLVMLVSFSSKRGCERLLTPTMATFSMRLV